MAGYEARTKASGADVGTFLVRVEPVARQAEARRLVAIFREVSGFEPRLWGPNIIGFGRYRYTYESGHSGEAPATGFSPRKAEHSIYIATGYAGQTALLAALGKHRVGKACVYLRHLDDADEAVLRRLIRAGLDELALRWPVLPE